MPLTPYQVDYLKQQGYSDEDIAKATVVNNAQPDSKLSTIGKTLTANAGGIVGGGAGTIGGAALGAELGALGGPAAPITVPVGAILGGIAGGVGGGYGGQSLQQAIEPSDLYAQQQQEATQSAATNPKTAAATDIIASALASGGKPSMDALRAGEGLIGKLGGKVLTPEAKQALIGTTFNAAVNPAINYGISQSTGNPESIGDVASQVLGGAVFSRQANWAGRLTGHGVTPEPEPEINNNDSTQTQDSGATEPDVQKADVATAFNNKDENGEYTLGNKSISRIFKSRINDLYQVPDNADDITKEQILTQKEKASNIDIDAKRDWLHQMEIGNQQQAMELLQGREFEENQKANKEIDNEQAAREAMAEKPEVEPEDNTLEEPKGEVNQNDKETTQPEQVRSDESHGTEETVKANEQGGSNNETEADRILQAQRGKVEQPEQAVLPILSKQEIQKKSDEDLQKGYDDYQEAGKQAIAQGKLQDASELITNAQWHREEMANRNFKVAPEVLQKVIEKGATKPVSVQRIFPNLNLSEQEASTVLSRAQALHNKLESLKVTGNGNLSMGIAPAIWNTALTMAQQVIKAGGTIKKAIDAAIAHIKANHQGVFDEDMTRKHIESNLSGETAKSQNLPSDKYMGKVGSVARAVIDKIHDIGTKPAHTIANAMKMALNKTDELKGRWKNAIVQAGEGLTNQDKTQLNNAFEARRLNGTNTIGMLSSPAARRFYNAAYRLLDDSGKYRISIGEPVSQVRKDGSKFFRLLRQDPNYMVTMPNQKVMDIIRSNTNPKAIEDLHKAFTKYNTDSLKLTPEESEKYWEDFTTAMRGDLTKGDMSHQDWFNASRKSMGNPLPPEFREQDPVLNLERYFDRSAIDAGHYEFMEKNHDVMAALGQKKDAWGNKIEASKEGSLASNPVVKAGLEQWRSNVRNPAEGNEHAVSSVVTATFISGPALEVHKTVSNVVQSLASTSNPVLMTRALINGLTHIASGYTTAVENGAVKMSARSCGNMISASATAAERMQGLAKTIRKISTLNDLTTKVGYGLVQSMNETIIPSKMERARNGDITAQKFLRNLDPSYDPNKTYSQAEISKYASKMAQYIHGTGDIRSLPHWMLNDSEVSGFFSLAHWSVAQTNNFMKNIYEPALRGELTPLLTGVFGATIGGYLIKDIREKIQGKHNQIPSLDEIAASSKGISGNPGLVGYNMISAMMYAGFGGLLSQVAKVPFDFVYKNTPQGATFPLDEVVTDMGETLHGVSEAIANDPNVNWVDLAKAVSMHVLSTNFQLGRIAVNQGINHGLITGLPAEKKELSDKMGQLRRFDMTEGLPYNDIETGDASYMNLEQKKFKSTQDLNQAMQELPQLVGNIMKTYGDKPDVLLQKLKALKQNQYATMPSMEDTPISFMKYIGYLNNLEGPKQAQKELMDYYRHKIINETKASVIP